MRPVWAVARSLITEVLRMRFLMAFVVLLIAGMTFGFAFWLYLSPGPADQELQTFLRYSVSFTWIVLSLLSGRPSIPLHDCCNGPSPAATSNAPRSSTWS